MKIKTLYVMITILLLIILVFHPVTIGNSLKNCNVVDGLCYGYIISIDNEQNWRIQFDIPDLINNLLDNEYIIYCIQEDITVFTNKITENNNPTEFTFLKGSYIIYPEKENKDFFAIIDKYNSIKNEFTFKLLEPIEDLEVFKLNKPQIAILTGNAIDSEDVYDSIKDGGFKDYEIIHLEEISNKLNNNDYNLLIWGGGSTNINIIYNQMEISSLNTIKNFVNNGGGYIGCCYGAYEIAVGSWNPYNWLKPYYPDLPSFFFLKFSTKQIAKALPGKGYFYVDIVDFNNPLSYGLPEEIPMNPYFGGPIFLGPGGNTQTFGVIKGLDNRWNNFMWNFNFTENVKDIWLSFAKGRAIFVDGKFGNGKFIAFGTHPEYIRKEKFELFEKDPEGYNYTLPNPPRLFYNAVFHACSNSSENIDFTEEIEEETSKSIEFKYLEKKSLFLNIFYKLIGFFPVISYILKF